MVTDGTGDCRQPTNDVDHMEPEADTFELELVVAIDAGQGRSRRHGRYLGLAPPGARF